MTSMQQVLNVLPLGTAFVVATAPFVDSVSLSLAAASQHYVPLLRLPWMWFGLVLASCCLSLFVNVSCFHIVLSMSALSYKMLSHAKTVILFAIGIMFRGQPVSQRQWIGAATTFVGVSWYLMQLETGSGGSQRASTSPPQKPQPKRTGRIKSK